MNLSTSKWTDTNKNINSFIKELEVFRTKHRMGWLDMYDDAVTALAKKYKVRIQTDNDTPSTVFYVIDTNAMEYMDFPLELFFDCRNGRDF